MIINTGLCCNDVLRKLVDSHMKNAKDKNIALTMLSNLVTCGIKTFMNQCFILSEHTNFIEQIFNQIILTSFVKQYQNEITYTPPTNDNNNVISFMESK